MLDHCNNPRSNQRRIFWTTQMCHSVRDDCVGGECGVPGILLECVNSYDCDKVGSTKFIKNDQWLTGLIYNILYTNGYDESRCRPFFGNAGGHWSDSFQKKTSGSAYVYQESYGSIEDAKRDLSLKLKKDLIKLIDYGVAVSVDVLSDYRGDNVFDVTVIVTTKDGEIVRVGLEGQKSKGIIAF